MQSRLRLPCTLCCSRGLIHRVSRSQNPSLHGLRQNVSLVHTLSVVRSLLHYYGFVRLPNGLYRDYTFRLPLRWPVAKQPPLGSPEFRIRDFNACTRSMTPENEFSAGHFARRNSIAFPITQRGRRSRYFFRSSILGLRFPLSTLNRQPYD